MDRTIRERAHVLVWKEGKTKEQTLKTLGEEFSHSREDIREFLEGVGA